MVICQRLVPVSWVLPPLIVLPFVQMLRHLVLRVLRVMRVPLPLVD